MHQKVVLKTVQCLLMQCPIHCLDATVIVTTPTPSNYSRLTYLCLLHHDNVSGGLLLHQRGLALRRVLALLRRVLGLWLVLALRRVLLILLGVVRWCLSHCFVYQCCCACRSAQLWTRSHTDTPNRACPYENQKLLISTAVSILHKFRSY